jgi:hypothetical protein
LWASQASWLASKPKMRNPAVSASSPSLPHAISDLRPETPAISTRDREAGDELRELYRKTVAAGFSSQPGELSADHVIEEIFAGGDGFGHRRNGGGPTHSRKSTDHPHAAGDGGGYWSDGAEDRPSAAVGASAGGGGGGGDKSPWPEFGGAYGKRRGSGGDARAATVRDRVRGGGGGAEEVFRSSAGGGLGRPTRGSFGAATAAAHAAVADMDKGWVRGSVPEVNELDVRDDLRCWNSRI